MSIKEIKGVKEILATVGLGGSISDGRTVVVPGMGVIKSIKEALEMAVREA